MKKWFLLLGLLAGLSGPAFAWGNPSLTYQVAISSAITNVVTASSSSATSVASQMDTPSLAGRVVLEVQNLDTSLNLFCSPSSGVKATTGRKIAAGNSWVLSWSDKFPTSGIASGAVHIYCVNDGTVGTTNAAVTQAY